MKAGFPEDLGVALAMHDGHQRGEVRASVEDGRAWALCFAAQFCSLKSYWG